ncbi:MAG: ATP synthase F1 subunit gamma [Candidatus Eisenbacteria bacterium]|nr:ATP synthase F1 subunit gamma [Candidatus Eisenbacteria bacterium]
MAKTREIKRRIKSLGKTGQITKTMELVAASRMKKTQSRVLATRPYANKLREILDAVDLENYADRFPLLRAHEEVRRVGVLVITSNRGLCGAFNGNVIRAARDMMRELDGAGVETELHVVGKKGIANFRYRGYAIESSRVDVGDKPTPAQSAEIARLFMERFLDGRIDEFRMVYASYQSIASHPPVMETVLPLPVERSGGEEKAPRAEFLLEPSPRAILESLLPRIVEMRVFKALLESAAGEQAARRIAMKNATDNANELIRMLTRQFNRARQAQITNEIAEIVGGADALV